jgi:hypothetical protein
LYKFPVFVLSVHGGHADGMPSAGFDNLNLEPLSAGSRGSAELRIEKFNGDRHGVQTMRNLIELNDVAENHQVSCV